MLITQADLAGGRIVLLPPEWVEFGSLQAALEALHRRCRKLPPWALPAWYLSTGADTEREVLMHCVPDRSSEHYLRPGGAVMVQAEGPEGAFVIEESRVDYDVIERATARVLAQVRPSTATDRAPVA